MVNELYTGLFILSFFLLIYLIIIFRKRISIYYVLLFYCVLITVFGYMQMADAETLKMALFANQTMYLGACFSPFFLMMCISDLCKVYIRRLIQAFFIGYGLVIFVLVSSIGITSGYYKEISLVNSYGVSSLAKVYGPLHMMYPINLALVMTIALWTVLYSFQRKEDVSYINSILMLCILALAIAVYAVEKIVKLSVPIMPFAYVLCEIFILFLLRRISLYDVTAISTDTMVKSNEFGFIMFDNRGRYLGGDVAAKHWFPEIKNWNIDMVAKDDTSELLKQANKWIDRQDDREIVYFEKKGIVIEAKHDKLRENKRTKVHLIYLRDDTKQQAYTRLVEKYNENLEHDVTVKTEKLYRVQNDIIISMASIVENRDNNTGGHVARTHDIVKIFIKHLLDNCSFEELDLKVGKSIVKAAALHDFGKIAIPDAILNKPGKFTDEEYAEMKKHSAKGAVIVEKILKNVEDTQFRNIAVNVAHYHHERWDGHGYPSGLHNIDIPFEARVMALADVFDALVSKRVYKDRMSYDKAFLIIEESCGTQFDPSLCKEFLKIRPQLEELYDSYPD